MSFAAALTLFRWLGPWADETKIPRIAVDEIWTEAQSKTDTRFRSWLYHPPHKPRGAYLVCPGLHFLGPAEPRLDRFCRILASAGYLVLAPFLPDFENLIVSPQVIRDLERAAGEFLDHPQYPSTKKLAVFSVSFGSLPAIRLACSPGFRDRIGGLIVFGGFFDFQSVVRFSVCATGQARDPLNQPVIFLNLLPLLQPKPSTNQLEAAWRIFVQKTWGQEMMKDRAQLRSRCPRDCQNHRRRGRAVTFFGRLWSEIGGRANGL